jgi:hypothetical protein
MPALVRLSAVFGASIAMAVTRAGSIHSNADPLDACRPFGVATGDPHGARRRPERPARPRHLTDTR